MAETQSVPVLPPNIQTILTSPSFPRTRLRELAHSYLTTSENWNFGNFCRLVYSAPEFSRSDGASLRRICARHFWSEAVEQLANADDEPLKQRAVQELARLERIPYGNEHEQTSNDNHNTIEAALQVPNTPDQAPPPVYKPRDFFKRKYAPYDTKRKYSELETEKKERPNTVKKSRAILSSPSVEYKTNAPLKDDIVLEGSPMSLCSTQTSIGIVDNSTLQPFRPTESPTRMGRETSGLQAEIQEDEAEDRNDEDDARLLFGDEDESTNKHNSLFEGESENEREFNFVEDTNDASDDDDDSDDNDNMILDESENAEQNLESNIFKTPVKLPNPPATPSVRRTLQKPKNTPHTPTNNPNHSSTSSFSSLGNRISSIENDYAQISSLRSRLSRTEEHPQAYSRLLHQEISATRVLISTAEDRLGADVRALRMDVDRLEERIRKLERRSMY